MTQQRYTPVAFWPGRRLRLANANNWHYEQLAEQAAVRRRIIAQDDVAGLLATIEACESRLS